MIAGGSYADAFGTAALPANGWSHLTETYDGAALRLYVNGTQVASTAHTGTIASSTNPLQIGGDSIYGQFFAGLIDEVRVYNVALTPAQIQTDQATPVNSGPDTQPPTQPGTLTANAVSGSEVDLAWGASSRQRRRQRLPARTLPGQRLQQLRPDRHPHRHELQGHQRQPLHQLQLPRPRQRRHQPEQLLEHRRRHHPHTRHAAADAAGDVDGDRGQRQRDRPGLGGLERQRRRQRLPARTLPGQRLQQLRPDRHPHRHELQGHRPQPLHQLQLPGPRQRRARQPEQLLEHRRRQHPRRPDRTGRGLRL